MVIGLFSKIKKIGSQIFEKKGRLFDCGNSCLDDSILKKTSLALEEKEKIDFISSIGSRYNISAQRVTKLASVIEFEYLSSGKSRSREEILEEEKAFSGDFRKFQTYLSQNSNNFIAKSIVQRVNQLYSANEGKKSVARIFHELKECQQFDVGFGYNPEKKRYEANVNSHVEDIRDLSLLKIRKRVGFDRIGASQRQYDNREMNYSEIEIVKRDVMFDLCYFGQKFSDDLKDYGFDISYKGFDDVLKKRYDFGGSNILRRVKKASSDGRGKPSMLESACI